MAIFIEGLVGIVVFYILILGVALWASKKQKDSSEEEMMLAGRNLGATVGALTLIATWVGGGYINGASDIMFSRGLLWAQVPLGYSLSLLVGAVLFIKPLREMQAVTLLDPFQKKYGNLVGSLFFIPAFLADIFWVAIILSTLGAALVVMTDINMTASIIISAMFVASYTSMGAMYSVTYTDVVQMFFILAGLVFCLPFLATSDVVDTSQLSETDWVGHIDEEDIWVWIDTMLLLILGGIPWQGYFQRILAIKTTHSAQLLSIFSTFACILMAMPAMYVGVIARVTDWEAVPAINRSISSADSNIILPLAIRYLTPEWVAALGLGALSAAGMSSADSSILAFSAYFTRNVYKHLLRARASQTEISWVMRITIVFITAMATVISLTSPNIYYLATVCADLVYVILFPHLLLLVYFPRSLNSYGCIFSFLLGCLLRILGGEEGLGIPTVLKYPGYSIDKGQLFPHRTFAMIVVLFTHIFVSWLTRLIFQHEILDESYDILKVLRNEEENKKLEMVNKCQKTSLKIDRLKVDEKW